MMGPNGRSTRARGRALAAGGFTLIEILVVLAIIGTLAAVLVPGFLHARMAAEGQAANLYAYNVFKAAYAYVLDAPGRTVATDDDCSDGYAAGIYTVAAAGPRIAACSVTDNDHNGVPEVEVRDRRGHTYRF